MRVAPKALIRRMTPTATRLLEAAVGKAATGGFYEITVEHLLAAMLEPDEGDVARVFHNWNVDRRRLLARVEKELQRQRTGNAGRPVISELVFSFLEDAWLTASV
ncbi:MAG: Clp protease N-terminal domain-containing protein, partial [Myxococcales bacterium]